MPAVEVRLLASELTSLALARAPCMLCAKFRHSGQAVMRRWMCSSSPQTPRVACAQFLSERLRLPASIAGVTVLSFAGGAPDLFTQLAAVSTGSGHEDLGLAVSSTLGSGLFLACLMTAALAVMLGGAEARTPSREMAIAVWQQASVTLCSLAASWPCPTALWCMCERAHASRPAAINAQTCLLSVTPGPLACAGGGPLGVPA